MFSKHFENIQNKVIDTVQLQLTEYTSSVNNHANYGVDSMLPTSFHKFDRQIDALMKNLDEIYQ